jgi:4-hydroxysphinganine ceramide fatty acyl 2-hydroxylase
MDGRKMESSIKLDYSKGIMWQLWQAEFNLEQYCKFVNEPKHFVNPVRDIIMFDNWIMEGGSRTHWSVVPLFWTPMMCWYLYCSNVGPLFSVLLMVYGFFYWGFMEYTMHRFIFHSDDSWLPDNKVAMFIHFLMHGIHHAFPMDRYRLVFPLIPALVLYFSFFLPQITLTLPNEWHNAAVAGATIGYIVYDLIHYFIHHSSPKDGSYMKTMKVYHMQHHYKNGLAGFGVSSKFWDKVFRTELEIK